MNEELLKETMELVSLIKNTKEYKDFMLIKEKLNNNKDIIRLLIKKNNIENDRYLNINKKKEELSKIINKLNTFNLINEYKEKEILLNNLLSSINKKLFNDFNLGISLNLDDNSKNWKI